MLKKLGLPMLALAGLLFFAAPRKADAEVHFGVYLGAPAYPVYPDPYANPYVDPYYQDYYYNNPYPVYDYSPPVYAYPNYGWGGHEYREHAEHERHERMEHGFRGGGHYREGYRGRR